MSGDRADEMADLAKRLEATAEAMKNIEMLLDEDSLTLEESAGKPRHTIQLLLSPGKAQFHYSSTLAQAGELLEGMPRPNGIMRQVYLQYHNEDALFENKDGPFTFLEDCPFHDGLEAFELIAQRLMRRHIC